MAVMRWIVDTHAHLDDSAFDEDRERLIDALAADGVLAVINPGCDLASSEKAVEIAQTHERIFACVGTHPHDAKNYDDTVEAAYRRMARAKKVVAIGECGLDYHYDLSPRATQRAVFERQLQLAKALDLPVVVHSREAGDDTYDILKNFNTGVRVILHSFAEDVSRLDRFLSFGYGISLGGMTTFKNAVNPKRLAQAVPIGSLMLETDAPYLAPVPKRGRRNHPGLAQHTLEAIAQLRGMDPAELAVRTTENAGRYYGISAQLKTLEGRA